MNALLLSFGGAVAMFAATRLVWEIADGDTWVTKAERRIRGLLAENRETPDQVSVITL